jgi:hypothetical protein
MCFYDNDEFEFDFDIDYEDDYYLPPKPRLSIDEAKILEQIVLKLNERNPWKSKGGDIHTRKIKVKKHGYGPLRIKAVLDDTIKDHEERKEALEDMAYLIESIIPRDRLAVRQSTIKYRSYTVMFPL